MDLCDTLLLLFSNIMSLTAAFEQIWEKKNTFFLVFFIVFTLMYSLLYMLDFLPEAPTTDDVDALESVEVSAATTVVAPAAVGVAAPATVTQALPFEPASVSGASAAVFAPISITIPKLSKTITVLNPSSRTVADLDAALLDGVVRHPDSALLNQTGNVFILGHSSYLPNVLNKNFQAFNGIQNLEWGDTIEVTSDGATFTYRVEKVYRAKASDLTVPIAGDKKKLTLATCNSFGTVDDRYIVEAVQINPA